jgi:hypothetical protein
MVTLIPARLFQLRVDHFLAGGFFGKFSGHGSCSQTITASRHDNVSRIQEKGPPDKMNFVTTYTKFSSPKYGSAEIKNSRFLGLFGNYCESTVDIHERSSNIAEANQKRRRSEAER